jgi:hypothetical protein
MYVASGGARKTELKGVFYFIFYTNNMFLSPRANLFKFKHFVACFLSYHERKL